MPLTARHATIKGVGLIPGRYADLSKTELIRLLEKRDRTKKLGLVWERDEIEADAAIDANFISCEIVQDLCDKPEPWQNLVIEGDNFDALRWLRMTCAGRVKCIYIDPPYNTGNKDWVYNDRYMDPENRFRQSTWLEFLYRRLSLARDLLADDGVMLISINDEQRALFELMADEAMPGMRIASFTWRTRTGGNDATGAFISENHEHVLIYSKPTFRFAGNEKTYEKYVFWDEGCQDHYRLSDISQPKDMDERPNGFYAMYDRATDTYYPANPQRVWPSPFPKGSSSYDATALESVFPVFPPDAETVGKVPPRDQIGRWVEQGRIVFPDEQRVEVWNSREELLAAIQAGDVPMARNTRKIWAEMPHLDFWIGKKIGFGIPQWVRYKRELKNATQPLSSWIVPLSETDTIPEGERDSHAHIVSGTNQEGTTEVQNVFGTKAFNYAKPVSLIRELVRQSTGPDDLVLDFFAGSATTAQAVMELNAEDGGDRRFIMVSSTEATTDEPDKNLCRDVTAGRIRRLNASKDDKYADLAAPFAYLRTKEVLFEDLDYDLSPAEAWTALEALHDLPLTVYDPDRPWNLHEAEGLALVLVDRFDPAFLDWLHCRDRQNLFVYAWAPGQIAQQLDGIHVDVRAVRDTLVKRFQQ